MSKTAITTINPAATCPAWCTSSHEHDRPVPNERGWWDVLHTSTPAAVVTDETLPEDAVATLTVGTQCFLNETSPDHQPRLVCVHGVRHQVNEPNTDLLLTAHQALRLAEVLVQLACSVLAEQAAEQAGVPAGELIGADR